MNRFTGKAAFVTGAGGYIGGTIAKMLAKEGACVAVCDLNEETAMRTVREIEEAGGRAIAVACNVTDSASVDRAMERAVAAFGRMDVLVHAAGGSARSAMKPLIEQTDEVIRSVLGVNLLGGIYASRAAAREMVRQGEGGRIVNISSVTGVQGNAGQANYAAAKAGLIGLTKTLAREFATRAITVNAVAPGFITTDMTAALPEEVQQKIKAAIPLARFGAPEDIAATVNFLCSENAGYITGQCFSVDGGMAM